jgi:hypothetical protein
MSIRHDSGFCGLSALRERASWHRFTAEPEPRADANEDATEEFHDFFVTTGFSAHSFTTQNARWAGVLLFIGFWLPDYG